MNILISCIGRRGYLARFFREAAGADSKILATSNSPWTPGFKDCDETFLLPDIASDGYIESVRKLCRDQQVNLLLSTLDLDIHRLSEHRQLFVDDGIATFVVPHRVSKICFDKLETVKFLEANGFAQPQTFATPAEAKTALDSGKLEYPVFVKPRFGFGSNNLFVARNHQELDVFWNYSPDMIIQEKLSGQEFSFDILNDLEGNVLRIVCKEKLLMRSGETDQAITRHSENLIEYAEKLGKLMAHVGPMDVDLFWNGETAYVLEMNPRFGGGYPISQIAGAGYPELMVAMAKGETVTGPLADFKAGIRMMKEIAAFECSGLVESTTDLR